MSALHQAVARAIADELEWSRPNTRVEAAAAAAIGVCLAEARRALRASEEALREAIEYPDGGGQPWSPDTYYDAATRDVLGVALAALAALAGEQA